MMETLARRYLDVIKASLLGEMYVENEVRLLYLRDCLEGTDRYDPAIALDIARARAGTLDEYRRVREVGRNYGQTIRNLGFQHTMIGRARLDSLETCVSTALVDGVPGDLMECGVWRGGATVLMRAVLEVHEARDRKVWVADSFAGLPPPRQEVDDDLDLSATRFPMLAIDQQTVEDAFRRYGLLDEQVGFLPGWFEDTLPGCDVSRLAVLRLDGDLYSSTWTALEALYDRVSPGGFVIVDDYGCLAQCRQAVDEFRAAAGIDDPIETIDWTGVYWRKSREAPH